MNKPDLDALEKLLVTEAADPFAFVEAAPALLAMARRTERLETELHNYETNHGARCDAEQERYATIAESACRMLKAEADRLDTMLGSNEFSARIRTFLTLPPHEVPGLRAKVAACDAALDACAARIAELLAQVGEMERELAEERARLADQAAAHEDEIRRQAAVAERVAANATKERARAERAERERDEARAALAEACAEVRRHNAAVPDPFGYMTDERRIDAWEGIASGTPARPPLDPTHVEVLRDMRRRANLEMAGAERDERLGTLSQDTVDWYRKRVAALEAALGEEARGQALPGDGTTEGI